METIENAIAELVRVYETAVTTLKADIAAFVENGTLPPADRRDTRAWCYPELRITYSGVEMILLIYLKINPSKTLYVYPKEAFHYRRLAD